MSASRVFVIDDSIWSDIDCLFLFSLMTVSVITVPGLYSDRAAMFSSRNGKKRAAAGGCS